VLYQLSYSRTIRSSLPIGFVVARRARQ